MNKAIFWKISIIGIFLLFVSGFAMCPNAMAQWGWGPQFTQGGWGFGSPFGQGDFFGSGFFSPPAPPTTTIAVAPVSVEVWDGWNDEGWEEFITEIQEEYPDLEGIDWDTWEDWDDADWEAFRTALDDVRTEESLENFISDVTEKWDEYDDDDWETFNTNWNYFIADAEADTDDDTELTWAGFESTYGCSDAIACFKAYATWSNTQWSDFRGMYSDYLNYEWDAFNETLQSKLEDYYNVDWKNWRDWTDAEWESYLNKYSNFRTSGFSGYGYGSTGGFGFVNPSGFGYNNPVGFSFGISGGYYGGFYGQGGYGYSAPSSFGYNNLFEPPSFGTYGGYGGYGGYGFSNISPPYGQGGYSAGPGGYFGGSLSWGGGWW